MRDAAYSRSFFFGPGLPRARGSPSPIMPGALLDPGFGPGIPFLFADPSAGTGVEEPTGVSVGMGVPSAAGVPFDSEAMSTGESSTANGVDIDDDLIDFGMEADSLSDGSGAKGARRLDGSLRMTTRFFFDVVLLSFDPDGRRAGVGMLSEWIPRFTSSLWNPSEQSR